jgi:hypothetical protein
MGPALPYLLKDAGDGLQTVCDLPHEGRLGRDEVKVGMPFPDSVELVVEGTGILGILVAVRVVALRILTMDRDRLEEHHGGIAGCLLLECGPDRLEETRCFAGPLREAFQGAAVADSQAFGD